MLQSPSLGSLCSTLSQANIMIYHYENKKWWERKRKMTTDKQINQWDRKSRIWCEKRNKLKQQIDKLLVIEIQSKGQTAEKKLGSIKEQRIPYEILPLSLMIDMLSIENIKRYDAKTKKGSDKKIRLIETKITNLIRQIDLSLTEIIRNRTYQVIDEVRTF